jgi:competence ComEA-like helix-hairpin-helix protein
MLPGARDVGDLPKCIEFWRSRIEGQGEEECFRVGLLFGPSGSGKTSLVRAGLLPSLSQRISVVHLEATADETETTLLRQMRKRCPGLTDGLGLVPAFIAARKGLTLPPGKELLVVIDQFERWLRVGRIGEQEGLVAALRQCDGEHVQALVVVRDDAWSAASRFMRHLGNRIVEGGNSAAVDPFDRQHARKILAAFGRAYGTLPEGQVPLSEDQEEFLDGAIAWLDVGDQILPVRLSLFADLVKGRAWASPTLEAVRAMGDVTTAFLEAAFHPEFAPPEHRLHRAAACSVLKSLLPEPGQDLGGWGRSLGDLQSASAYTSQPRHFESLMRILGEDLRLIICAETEAEVASGTSPTGDQHHCRLTHDFLVEPLRDWLTREEGERPRSAAWSLRHEPKFSARIGPVNINTATEEELRSMPGIGAAIAHRIIGGRPYRAIDHLLKVKGIGGKTLEGMRPLIKVE